MSASSSSRFVSAGTATTADNSESVNTNAGGSGNDDAWQRAQEAIEASRKQKELSAGSGLQEGGKSLYEVLQANKAAKQDAFEESIRLKNQVQLFNEEDAEYLESVAEKERAQKAASEKEAREQLAAFRKQQDTAERIASVQVAPRQEVDEAGIWQGGNRKRKNKEQEFVRGVRLRKSSSTDTPRHLSGQDSTGNEINITGTPKATTAPKQEKAASISVAGIKDPAKSDRTPQNSPAFAVKAPKPPSASLGLVDYSSDEDN